MIRSNHSNHSNKTSRSMGSDASQLGRALMSLREMVLRGEFKPGERILEAPLAARTGVSRTPIRLALERLAQEGLLESISGIGFTVREFTMPDVWDAIETRGVLEGTAARLAAERLADPQDLEALWMLNRELDALVEDILAVEPFKDDNNGEFAQYAELNGAFHKGVVDLARSPILAWSLERIRWVPFAAPDALVFPSCRNIIILAVEHHRGILESIGSREGSRAESLAREHARLVRQNLEIALNENTDADLARVPGAALISAFSPSRPGAIKRPARVAAMDARRH